MDTTQEKTDNLAKSLRSRLKPNILYLDVETTGLDDPQIIELAFKVNDRPTRKYRFKTTKLIDIGASKVHGIYADDLKDKPYITKTFAKRLQRLIDGSVLVAHNARFDVGCLRNHSIYVNRFLCTKSLAQVLNKFDGEQYESFTLDNVAKHYNVSIERPIHDAGIDVDILYEVYQNLVSRINKIIEPSNIFKLLWISRASVAKNASNPFDDVKDLKYDKFINKENVLKFGKHKGKSLFQIMNTDFGYLKWCFENLDSQDWRYRIQFLYNELNDMNFYLGGHLYYLTLFNKCSIISK